MTERLNQIGVGTLYASAALDGLLTQFAIEHNICYEANPLMAEVITNYGWTAAFSLKFATASLAHMVAKGVLKNKSKYASDVFLVAANIPTITAVLINFYQLSRHYL